MIRSITVVALLMLLVLVLYLPSAYPPQRFVDTLKADHAAVADFWGDRHAYQLLETTLSRQGDLQDIAPIPNAYDAPTTGRAGGAVANEMTSVSERLFNSPYFRSVDAMLLLATYRGGLGLKWLPWLMAFPVSLAVDSAIRRRVKAMELVQHDPEVFAVLSCAAIAAFCATILLLVLPVPLHPGWLPAAPVVALSFAASSIASFHARR